MEKHTLITHHAASESVQSGQHTDLTTEPSPLWSIAAGMPFVACITGSVAFSPNNVYLGSIAANISTPGLRDREYAAENPQEAG